MAEAVDALLAESSFSGVVRVDREGTTVLARAVGLADRAHGIGITFEHQFGIASGTKTLTALAVLRLVELGGVELGTPARALLGPDLPRIDPSVTVEHLLSHTSGIGDYLDEDTIEDLDEPVLPIPVHRLVDARDYLPLLDLPMVRRPGEQFAYNNGAFVVLALLIERVTGSGYHDAVRSLVLDPAGMTDTDFLRSDELPGRAAVGYLGTDGLRTNVLHLPVRGSGDGGIHTTVGDVHRLWDALLAGRIVAPATVAAALRPRNDVPAEGARYGLGFWCHATTDTVWLEGADAGVSFRSVHAPGADVTHTVVSNTTRGAWPVTRLLDSLLLA